MPVQLGTPSPCSRGAYDDLHCSLSLTTAPSIARACRQGAALQRAMPDRRQSSGVLTELALYAVSALISFALLNNVLKKLDPNQQNSKQARWPRACHFSRLCGGEAAAPVALQRLSRVSRRTQATAKRKEISARLGRPVLETNQYEDVRLQTLRLSRATAP